MKKLSLIFTVIIAVGSMGLFVGCGRSARDELNHKESVVYDAFIEKLCSFYNPQSIKIIEYSDIFSICNLQNPYFVTVSEVEVGHRCIKANIQTKSGGSSSVVYCLIASGDDDSDYKIGYIWTWDDVMNAIESFGWVRKINHYLSFFRNLDYYTPEDENVDVRKLNRALHEYFEEKGML